MGGKQGESTKRKDKPQSPSTGRGAASALDELIKRRVQAPAQGQQHQPQKTKKQ